MGFLQFTNPFVCFLILFIVLHFFGGSILSCKTGIFALLLELFFF